MLSFDVTPLEGYREPYGLLLSALHDSTREWLGELGEPSEDALEWQARPGGHSIGGQILHICFVELFWFQTVALGKTISDEDAKRFMARETDVDSGAWPTPPRQPFSWYREQLANVRERTDTAFREFPAPEKTFQLSWGSMTTRWIVAHVIQHDSYHGGQAVLLHDLFQALK